MLEYLASKGNLKNQKLFKLCTVKVVPMINIDGVISGNYRTGYIGKDMNRLYMQDEKEEVDVDKLLMPEIIEMKNLISSVKKNLLAFIDVH